MDNSKLIDTLRKEYLTDNNLSLYTIAVHEIAIMEKTISKVIESYCTFDTGMACTLTTGHNCTFIIPDNCTFKTNKL